MTKRPLGRAVHLLALALVAAVLPATTTGGAAGAAADRDVPDLLTSEPVRGATARSVPTTVGAERSRLARLDSERIADSRVGDRWGLGLFADTEVVGTIDHRESHELYDAWSGTLEGGGTFTVVRAGRTHRVQAVTPEGTFVVTQGVGETVRISEVDPVLAEDAADHPDQVAPPRAERMPSPRRAQRDLVAGDAGNRIDVLVASTPQAVAEAGGLAQLQAIAGTFVQDTNTTFANSAVPAQVRLVGVQVTAQDQTGGSIRSELDAITQAGDGLYDDIHTVREQTHADQVTFLVGGSSSQSCGLGWLQGGQTRAFTTSYISCLPNLTFTHEIGHNLGADHDRYPGVTNFEQVPDAAGFVSVPGRFETVMAYPNACYDAGVSCTRLRHFSNPAVSYNGRPTGGATAYNARVVASNAATMANFRQEQIYPGTVALAGSARNQGTVTAVTSGWAPSSVTLSFQWYLDGVPAGNGPTFRPGRSDIGKTLGLTVVGSAPFYPSASAASAPVVVAKGRFRARRPALRGAARVGRVVAVELKRYRPSKKVRVRYQWYRDGKKIKGAGSRRYRVRPKDRKDKLHCVVKLKKRGYETARLRTRKVKVRR